MSFMELQITPKGALYCADCRKCGATLYSHESDLYVKDSRQAREIIRQHGHRARRFIDNIEGKPWLEVPFAYAPWWRARGKV